MARRAFLFGGDFDSLANQRQALNQFLFNVAARNEANRAAAEENTVRLNLAAQEQADRIAAQQAQFNMAAQEAALTAAANAARNEQAARQFDIEAQLKALTERSRMVQSDAQARAVQQRHTDVLASRDLANQLEQVRQFSDSAGRGNLGSSKQEVQRKLPPNLTQQQKDIIINSARNWYSSMQAAEENRRRIADFATKRLQALINEGQNPDEAVQNALRELPAEQRGQIRPAQSETGTKFWRFAPILFGGDYSKPFDAEPTSPQPAQPAQTTKPAQPTGGTVPSIEPIFSWDKGSGFTNAALPAVTNAALPAVTNSVLPAVTNATVAPFIFPTPLETPRPIPSMNLQELHPLPPIELFSQPVTNQPSVFPKLQSLYPDVDLTNFGY